MSLEDWRGRLAMPVDLAAMGESARRMGEALIRSGSLILGCARMDPFLGRIGEPPPEGKTIIALFTAPANVSRSAGGEEFEEISHSMVLAARAAARLLKSRPGVELHVKMKSQGSVARWREKLEPYKAAVIEEFGEVPANVVFLDMNAPAHDLILASTVVVASQSTVVLEAALAGKPVILPHFKFVREHPEAPRSLMYREHHALFDVPEDEADLERLLVFRLANPHVDESVMAARRELFARYVSTLDAAAAERCAALIRRLAETGRETRRKNRSRGEPRGAASEPRASGKITIGSNH